LKKNCAGAILSSFKKDSLLNMEIPIINSDVQDKIAILIKKSFSLRKESEIIIEASKRSIEIAIEQDVQSAISYMKSALDGDLLNVSAISQETNYTTSVDDAKDNHVPTINLHIVEENENKTIPLYDEYHEGRIPLYTLRAACGYFEDGEVPEEEGWVDATGHGFTPDPKRHFVVHAKGNSMLPKIKDGDLCVFEWYRAGSRNGEIVLTQSSEFDSEYGGKYTIKKYRSEKVVTEEGWQHSKVELIPLNKDFDVIELDEETEYRTIGVLKCVLSNE
jgi:SOS-response transcriptional repressor LexA